MNLGAQTTLNVVDGRLLRELYDSPVSGCELQWTYYCGGLGEAVYEGKDGQTVMNGY